MSCVEMRESGEESSSSESEEASSPPPPPQGTGNPHENLDFSYDSVHEDDDEGNCSKSEDGEVTDDEEEQVLDDGEVLEDGEVNVTVKIDKVEDEQDSVEEGEVTDEEVISELDRKDNKPVCRFFSKGQCTWGNNCRFLHPGVTDKGLYTMFETVPPPPPREMRESESSRVQVMHGPPIIESAWERGLRHAKEIIKASAKRKETDVDFEEKKINLSLAGDEEIDKENNDYYVRKPELHVGKLDVLDDPDYGLHSPIPSDFTRPPKIDPEFVRERVHRIKGPPQGVERSPPPRRMVRESELRKMEIEMMMGDEKRDNRRTDAYGRALRPPQRDFRNVRQRVQSPPQERGFKRSRSTSRSSSSSSSSSSSKSSRRRRAYYSRGSDDSRSRKRKRTDSSGSESSASRRRARRSSGTSTSRSRSKSANDEERGRRRRRTVSTTPSSRSTSSERARRFVRKAPPREPATASPKPVRIAPPLPHFDSGAQDAAPEHHGGGRENTRWGQATYRRAPPATTRAPRYFQNTNMQHERPVGLVRERDLHNQGGYGGSSAPPQTPPPTSPTNSQKTPVPSPSSSPRRKTRYKREYSSDHELASVSRSRSRSYSRSNSGSDNFRAKRESRSSRSSSFSSSSNSRSRSRSRNLSPPASPVPAPPVRSRSTSSNRSNNAIVNKPKANQIKLTLKPRERVQNKHVIERLGGADEDEHQHFDKAHGVGSVNEELLDLPEQIASPSPPQEDDGEEPRPSRREELLKQLKAVEEAIAKKRSKLDVPSK